MPEARNSSQVSARRLRFGMVEIKLHSIECFMAQHTHTGKLAYPSRHAAYGRLLCFFRNVQVDPAVLVLAKFLLQRGYQRAQGAAFLGHDIGQQK